MPKSKKSKSKRKVLKLNIIFTDDLVETQNAYGLYYRMQPKSNTVNLYIDNRQPQLHTINTLFHEFSHFIMDLMTNFMNYKRFFTLRVPKDRMIHAHPELSDTDVDANEEVLCNKIAKSCEKRVYNYLTK